MNDDWIAWAKEEIISFHKLVVEQKAKIAELEKQNKELIIENGKLSGHKPHVIIYDEVAMWQAEERGAEGMLGVFKRQGLMDDANASMYMQLWKESKAK